MFKIFLLLFICYFMAVVTTCFAAAGALSPQINSICQIDLTDDKTIDLVFLMESANGRELLILSRGQDNSYSVFTFGNLTKLTLAKCAAVKEFAEKKSKKIHATNGTAVILYEPEGAARAIYYYEGKFRPIWISD